MPELAAPTDLRFEHHPADRPVLGIGTATPRLSWRVPAAPDDWAQARYEIEVSRGGILFGVIDRGGLADIVEVGRSVRSAGPPRLIHATPTRR